MRQMDLKKVIIRYSQYAKLNLNPSPKSNRIFNPSNLKHENKTMARVSVRVRVGVNAWIKIYIRHAENTELLPRKIK